MTLILRSLLVAGVLIALCRTDCSAQGADVRVLFIEPAAAPTANGADVYRIVTDSVRVRTLESWMANESAHMALDLYTMAWGLTPEGRRGDPPVYYVALVPGGNDAAVGLSLLDDSSADVHARTSFIKLAPEDWAFTTTLLHETGHVVLSMLNDGSEIPRTEIAPISHTTAALTDRGTAFDEGFAIHLETLAAHLSSDTFLRDRYHHQRFRFGVPHMSGEFHRHAADLLSFSQTIARYYEVRENNFAFSPAYTGPDCLRVELEKSQDFASLRDANQLLQSEGFYASFFFSLLMRGDTPPTLDIIRQRQQKVLQGLADMFASGRRQADDPFLLLFVDAYCRRFPAEAGEIIDVLLDLSHGVFVDRGAATLWREHYLRALQLDLAERSNANLEAARMRWRMEVTRDRKALYRNLGPQIRAEVMGRAVTLVAFGEGQALSFDLNTVEEGVIRLVPGISRAEVENWLLARGEKPFVDVTDFTRRARLRAATLRRLVFK